MGNSTSNKCQLCGSTSHMMHDSFPGYQEGMLFEIHFCNECNTSFPKPTADASEIYDFIYKHGENVPGYDRYWEYFNKIKNQNNPLKFLADSEEAYWGVKEAINQRVIDKKNAKILEIGSGLGYLTYALRKDNYNVFGLDISDEAVNQANANFGNFYVCRDLFDYSKTHAETFDVVILTEVIEHVEKPIDFLKAITQLLKKNGAIILTTPNKSIAPDDIIWDTEAPPIHHWWLSENSIEYIANFLKCSVRFVDFEKFYKKKPTVYRFGAARRKILRAPILSENMELLKTAVKKKPTKLKKSYKNFIASIPYLKMTFLKLKIKLGNKSVYCSKRGKILCAILLKEEGV